MQLHFHRSIRHKFATAEQHFHILWMTEELTQIMNNFITISILNISLFQW